MVMVTNRSEVPLPSGDQFSLDEKKRLAKLERRSTYEEQDDSGYDPLTDDEREEYQSFKDRQRDMRCPMVGTQEYRFDPGDWYYIPADVAYLLMSNFPNLEQIKKEDPFPTTRPRAMGHVGFDNVQAAQLALDDSPHGPWTQEIVMADEKWVPGQGPVGRGSGTGK